MGLALGVYWSGLLSGTKTGVEEGGGKEGFSGNGSEVKSYKVMGDVGFGRSDVVVETKRGRLHGSVLFWDSQQQQWRRLETHLPALLCSAFFHIPYSPQF